MKKLKLNNTELSELFKKLVLFLQAGVGPANAMSILADEEKDPLLKEFYKTGSLKMDEGQSLSSVFEGGAFPLFISAILKVGENVGRTEQTLSSLSDYFNNRARINAQVKNALLYPAILFIMMMAVIVILLSKVLPVFQSVYASLGGSLTGISAGLLKLGQALNTALPYMGIGLGVIILAVIFVVVNEKAKEKVLKLWRNLSSDKGVSKKLNSARFAQALAMCVSSGMILEEAIETAGTLLSESPKAALRVNNCCEEIRNGKDALEALMEADILDMSSCRMLSLGFKAGKGDETMWEIAEQLSYKADEALEQKVSQIEPALVLVTSVLVGVILLSVMLPLVDIMNAI